MAILPGRHSLAKPQRFGIPQEQVVAVHLPDKPAKGGVRTATGGTCRLCRDEGGHQRTILKPKNRAEAGFMPLAVSADARPADHVMQQFS